MKALLEAFQPEAANLVIGAILRWRMVNRDRELREKL